MQLALVGIGTGNPDHLTFEAVDALRAADLILLPRKGAAKTDLADLRRAICARVLPTEGGPDIVEFDMPRRETGGGYLDDVEAWHDAVAVAWQAALQERGSVPATVALLIWGDPSLYDSSLRIAARLTPAPRVRVIPGITALQALTAAHAIPLNTLGAPVLVTTGRRLTTEGWPEGVDTLAVMLDGGCAFTDLPGGEIWWGAYLGMPEQILAHGHLPDVAADIVSRRAEARARHGWIMDTYLLRR